MCKIMTFRDNLYYVMLYFSLLQMFCVCFLFLNDNHFSQFVLILCVSYLSNTFFLDLAKGKSVIETINDHTILFLDVQSR